MFEEKTQAALMDIYLVDKAVNYILGQPDGELHYEYWIFVHMLIYSQLTELCFEDGGESVGWGKLEVQKSLVMRYTAIVLCWGPVVFRIGIHINSKIRQSTPSP